ncbi:hypothetical protein DB88DRAFT_486896 [Papiliotrema laurentii]|uniref:Uncharacterized protein n=1 Tax=Papiliotrema laurentii TaxID=5418 RepID=A0AAD9FR98_PAPLA|nr:hypothetical protein DB88DRAFT_486896 [Papiliotrema laurentii]
MTRRSPSGSARPLDLRSRLIHRPQDSKRRGGAEKGAISGVYSDPTTRDTPLIDHFTARRTEIRRDTPGFSRNVLSLWPYGILMVLAGILALPVLWSIWARLRGGEFTCIVCLVLLSTWIHLHAYVSCVA